MKDLSQKLFIDLWCQCSTVWKIWGYSFCSHQQRAQSSITPADPYLDLCRYVSLYLHSLFVTC